MISVCTQTVYNYIDKGQMGKITNKLLRVKSRDKKKKKKKVRRLSYQNPINTSIEERSSMIDDRSEFGHWEMDSVKSGAAFRNTLLVLIERLTRNVFIYRCESTFVAETKRVLDTLENRFKANFKRIFKTITVDNGSEFLDEKLLEKSCRTKGNRTQFYYCHPYSSYERGSNENVNRVVRYYVPKGSDIGALSDDDIARIQEKINFMPRKIFAYDSANDRFLEALACLDF